MKLKLWKQLSLSFVAIVKSHKYHIISCFVFTEYDRVVGISHIFIKLLHHDTNFAILKCHSDRSNYVRCQKVKNRMFEFDYQIMNMSD